MAALTVRLIKAEVTTYFLAHVDAGKAHNVRNNAINVTMENVDQATLITSFNRSVRKVVFPNMVDFIDIVGDVVAEGST